MTPAEIEQTHRAATLLADAWGPALEREYERGRREGFHRGYRTAELAMCGAYRQAISPPRRCSCGNCSVCIRQRAVQRNRERYGQDNYPGRDGTLPAGVTT
jgi:hypothetical protein